MGSLRNRMGALTDMGKPQRRSLAAASAFVRVYVRVFAAIVTITLGAGFASPSLAQLYKWTDDNGKVQYSDTVPPAALDRARKELRTDGTVKADTQRAATMEERRLAAMKAVEDAKLKVIQDERDRKDKALLSSYTDLADFDRVRDRTLATMDAEYTLMTERESLLKKAIALPPGAPPLIVSAPSSSPSPSPSPSAAAAAPVPGKPPPAPTPPKPSVLTQTEARSELPRLTDAMARKKRDREDVVALYGKERARLAGLIATNDALISGGPAKPAVSTVPPVPARR